MGLKLIDAIPQKTHGGSMRYVVCRKNSKRKISRNVKKNYIPRKKYAIR